MPIIKIYYDNTSVEEGIKPEWGFSALVKYQGKNILFDTGGNAGVLEANIKKMGSDPKYFDCLVISHAHWDHINGLPVVLRPGQKVYLLKSFPENLKGQVKTAKAELVEVAGSQQIMGGVYTTGEMGDAIKEQSLVVDTEKGLIIVTGCSHPGIVNIVRRAKEDLKKDIYYVIGGFHLYDLSDEQINGIIAEIKALGVKKISPCHCTGEKAISLFEKKYPKDFIKIGAGSIIDTARL